MFFFPSTKFCFVNINIKQDQKRGSRLNSLAQIQTSCREKSFTFLSHSLTCTSSTLSWDEFAIFVCTSSFLRHEQRHRRIFILRIIDPFIDILPSSDSLENPRSSSRQSRRELSRKKKRLSIEKNQREEIKNLFKYKIYRLRPFCVHNCFALWERSLKYCGVNKNSLLFQLKRSGSDSWYNNL